MKNIVFFVVLAILTVAALVGWNAIRQQSVPNETAQTVQPTSTPEIGTAVGRDSGMGAISNQNATNSAGFGNTTKGAIDTSTVPVATTASRINTVATPVPTSAAQTSGVVQANTVVFTDNGFTPKTLTVKTGTMVKFLNQSTKRMWVESADIAGGKKLEQFDMGVSVGRDGFYEFQFNSTGTWGFFDHTNQNLSGSIVVN